MMKHISAFSVIFLILGVSSDKECSRIMRSGIADKKGEFFYKKQILKVDCSGQNVTTIDSGFLRGIIREEEKIQLRRTPKAFQGILYQALHDEGVTKHIGYYLTLEEASIKEIEDGVFNELPSLEGLNLKNNKLKKIARRSFEGLRHLTDLSLDGNEISQIESSSFFDLQNVKYLTATMNALKDVDYFSFQGLSKSNILNLSNNSITLMNSGTFAGAPLLEHLYLSHNRIRQLTGGTMAGLVQLKTLLLDNNIIKTISDGTFLGMRNLEHLDLSNNYLSKIKFNTFKGLYYLRRLKLQNNKLISIEDQSFISMPLLRELDISNNGLSTMTRGLFTGLINLQVFQISNNWMHEKAAERDEDLLDAIQIICRKPGLHYADVRGNGLRDMLQGEDAVTYTIIDFSNSDQHRCVL